MRFYLFCLEFSLMQLVDSDGKEDSTTHALYNKYLSVFGLIPVQGKEYQTVIQSVFNPRDLRSSGLYLLKLYYHFNKDRSFRGSSNNQITSLEQIGFYFLENEYLFNDINLILEKEKYISDHQYNISPALNFSEFIFTCFSDKVELQLEIHEIKVDKKRNYKVGYFAYKTLNDFLKSVNISREFSDAPSTPLQIQFKGAVFGSVQKESDMLIQLFKEKHNPFQLKDVNIDSLKMKFKSMAWPQLYRMFLPQAVALVICFVLFTLIILILTKMIQIGEDWSLIWS